MRECLADRFANFWRLPTSSHQHCTTTAFNRDQSPNHNPPPSVPIVSAQGPMFLFQIQPSIMQTHETFVSLSAGACTYAHESVFPAQCSREEALQPHPRPLQRSESQARGASRGPTRTRGNTHVGPAAVAVAAAPVHLFLPHVFRRQTSYIPSA